VSTAGQAAQPHAVGRVEKTFCYEKEEVMTVSFTSLQPGEQVIIYTKGVTIRELISGLIFILFGPFFFGCAIGFNYNSISPEYQSVFITLTVVLVSFLWLAILVKLIIRVFTAKSILTDRRVILVAYNFLWDRVEIPLSDIENIIDKSIMGTQIIRRSQKAIKYYAIANSKAFVNAYNLFISSNRST
jgi:hypothetical protein